MKRRSYLSRPNFTTFNMWNLTAALAPLLLSYSNNLDNGPIDRHLSASDSLDKFVDMTGLVGNPIKNLTLIQGMTGKTTFSIGIPSQPSNDSWKTAIQILSVPTQGDLFLAYLGGLPLTNRTILAGSGNGTGGYVNMQYKAFDDEYFNIPSTNSKGENIPGVHPESFTYRILAVDRKTREIFNISKSIVQHIFVLNVNDKPTLSTPKLATPIEGQSTVGSTRMFTIDNFRLQDIDMNVDKVRVTMWANNGSLYLNEEFIELADFNDCASRYAYKEFSNWKCRGRGRSDRNMTFVAQPDDVNKLLNGMVYSPYYGDNDDYITIEIFDGQDGDCLVEAEHVTFGNNVSSVRNGCFVLRGRVYVPASEQIIRAEDKVKPNFIERALRRFGVDTSVNIVTFIWWIVILASALALYENLLQCLGTCCGCCLPKKCLAWLSILSWISWLLCCCGRNHPMEQDNDWPDDEEISTIHINDGFLYERSKHRKPAQWRRTPIAKIV